MLDVLPLHPIGLSLPIWLDLFDYVCWSLNLGGWTAFIPCTVYGRWDLDSSTCLHSWIGTYAIISYS
jgi:hypothetical protein